MKLVSLGACLLLPCFALTSPAVAEVADPGLTELPAADPAPVSPAPGDEDQAAALAKKLANPIAALISVPLQNNVDWGGGPGGDGVQYKLNIQPVIPITLNSRWNLISRTIVPLFAQKKILRSPPAPDNTQFGFGDTVHSLWLSPQQPGKSGIIWGVGSAFLLRTASEDLLSSGKWGAGPTVVVLKQTGRWTVGGLANHIWSFAGDGNRDKVSSTFVQPFISYTTPRATTFAINSETTYDWRRDTWTIPVNLTVAQLFPPSKTGLSFPLQIQGGYRHYFDAPRDGPSNGVRFTITALFPKK